jgi:hypothetical protein
MNFLEKGDISLQCNVWFIGEYYGSPATKRRPTIHKPEEVMCLLDPCDRSHLSQVARFRFLVIISRGQDAERPVGEISDDSVAQQQGP